MPRPSAVREKPEAVTGAADPEPLPDGALVDLAAERPVASAHAILSALEAELVGLAPVKARVREIAALLIVDGARARFGLTAERPTLHMCFTGNPGTGKTTVAQRMGELLHGLGYLRRGHLVSVTRDDLVGQYVGHTAPKTKEVLKRAMGGVLFIDEAYYLYRAENERDYGGESIEILLQYMENNRDDLVVVLAGYADRMETFFASNPGMSSRIAHHLDFPDYTLDELAAIGGLMLDRQRYRLSDEAGAVFREYLERRMTQPRFANARSVRNALERARLRHASRLTSAPGPVGKDDLMRLEPADLLTSRVFAQLSPGGRPPVPPGTCPMKGPTYRARQACRAFAIRHEEACRMCWNWRAMALLGAGIENCPPVIGTDVARAAQAWPPTMMPISSLVPATLAVIAVSVAVSAGSRVTKTA
jgi:probable Rubsico expression protein CbbX